MIDLVFPSISLHPISMGLTNKVFTVLPHNKLPIYNLRICLNLHVKHLTCQDENKLAPITGALLFIWSPLAFLKFQLVHLGK